MGQRQPFEQHEHGARLDAYVADAHVAALIDDERVLRDARLTPPVAEPTAVEACGTGGARRPAPGEGRVPQPAWRDARRSGERRQDALSDMAAAASRQSRVTGFIVTRRRRGAANESAQSFA